MFGRKARNRRAERRADRRANRAANKAARRDARASRAAGRQETRLSKAQGRQDVKMTMAANGIDPNAWVGDVTSGMVGLANAASSYGVAKQFSGSMPGNRQGVGTIVDEGNPGAGSNILPLAAIAGAVYYFSKK